MKILRIKAENLSNILTAMTVFNELELVKIEYSYNSDEKKHIVTGVFGLLNKTKLKNRISRIEDIVSEKLIFEVHDLK